VLVGVISDLPRGRTELILENMLLRQQLIVLQRQLKRSVSKGQDRLSFVLLASRLRTWKQALLIVQPDTLLRWHRDLFKWVWRRKSKSSGHRRPLPAPLIALIKRLVIANRLWGAERIRGELLKLGLRVSKRAIQKYARQVAPPRRGKQTWTTFIHSHASAIWSCDLLQIMRMFFRDLFLFFILEVGSRRTVHVGVTRHPTDAWLAQQLREATPFGPAPKYLIRDNDDKFSARFAVVAVRVGIEVFHTPPHAPKTNAFVERLLGSVRRECLDHLLIFGERHLHTVIRAYVEYYTQYRPHQGLQQPVPASPRPVPVSPPLHGNVRCLPVLGGLLE
jgi:transposase InsO family protein